MDGFLAARAFLEIAMLVALVEQMLSERVDFNDLGALAASCQHGAYANFGYPPKISTFLPEMDVELVGVTVIG